MKNPYFWSSPHENLRKWLSHDVIIFTKFHEDMTKNVDFSSLDNFWECLVFISSDFIKLARCLELSNSPGYSTPQKGHVRSEPCELYIQGWHKLNKPMIDTSMISHAKWHACYQLKMEWHIFSKDWDLFDFVSKK